MQWTPWCGMALLAALVWAGAARPSCAQAAPASDQPAQAQSAPQPQSEQAYTLPPEKLAKAIALNRIRLTLEIVGSVWGLLVIGLLLATRAASGLERWT
ncbi:MAG: hypothetical protein WBW68_18265, partial [Terracidiphilus sp.]